MRRILAIACIASGLWAAAGQAAGPDRLDQIDLRPLYRVGHIARQRLVSKTVGSIKMFDPLPEQKFTQTFEQDTTMKCRKVNADKSAVVDMTLDRIAMKMSIAGINVDFDSSIPATQPEGRDELRILRKILSAMIGSQFTMTMGPDGQPTRMEGMKETMKKMSEQLADEKMPAFVKKMFDQMANMFDDQSMLKGMEECHRMIPEKGIVRVGEKWERKWDMKLPMFNGRIEGGGQYELLGIEEFRGRPCAKIGVKESFRMAAAPVAEKPAAPTASAPAKDIFERLQFDLQGSGGDGVAYWDYKAGELLQLRQTQRITMSIAVLPDANAEPSELKKGSPMMVQKLNTSVSVDLLDDTGAGSDPAASAGSVIPAGGQK